MGKHNLGYFLHEGVSNMFSHGFMSFAAIGITVACLLIMGTFTLVAVNANELLAGLEQENEILAFIDETYSRNEALGVQRELEALPNVLSTTYVSKRQAMDNFAEKYADDPLFQNLDPEILRDRYVVKIQNLERQSQTVAQLRQGLRGDRHRLYRDPQHRLRGVHRLDCDPICRVGVYYLQHHQAHHL